MFYSDVKEGSVRVAMVLGVPRSVSSATAKALSASPDFDIYIFQPMYETHTPQSDVRAYVKEAKEQKASYSGKPLNVIMKVMAESVSPQRFTHLMRNCEKTCVLVRDPQAQALSAFRALYKYPSGKELTLNELEELRVYRNTKALSAYIDKPWKRIGQQVGQLTRYTQNEASPQTHICIADGDLLRIAPEATLREISKKLHIHYTPGMLDGWTKEEDKTVGLNGQGYAKSWLGRVQRSRGLRSPTMMTPRLEDFSSSVRPVIEENLKTYAKVLGEPSHILPSAAALDEMMAQGMQYTSPIAIYTLASALPASRMAESARVTQRIREEMPEYTSSYAIIDKALHKTPKHVPSAGIKR